MGPPRESSIAGRCQSTHNAVGIVHNRPQQLMLQVTPIGEGRSYGKLKGSLLSTRSDEYGRSGPRPAALSTSVKRGTFAPGIADSHFCPEDNL
jgi:hypothetical protein